jgi:hypothetical protein
MALPVPPPSATTFDEALATAPAPVALMSRIRPGNDAADNSVTVHADASVEISE